MLRGVPRLLLTAAVLALAGAACSGGVPAGALDAERLACPPDSECYDPPRAPGDGGQISMQSHDFFYDDFQGEVAEGDIEVTLNNQASGAHNIVFVGANEGSDDVIQADGGGTASGTVNLFAGDYTFFCSIPGHRAAGMEGTLSVTPEPAPAAELATPLQAQEG